MTKSEIWILQFFQKLVMREDHLCKMYRYAKNIYQNIHFIEENTTEFDKIYTVN